MLPHFFGCSEKVTFAASKNCSTILKKILLYLLVIKWNDRNVRRYDFKIGAYKLGFFKEGVGGRHTVSHPGELAKPRYS